MKMRRFFRRPRKKPLITASGAVRIQFSEIDYNACCYVTGFLIALVGILLSFLQTKFRRVIVGGDTYSAMMAHFIPNALLCVPKQCPCYFDDRGSSVPMLKMGQHMPKIFELSPEDRKILAQHVGFKITTAPVTVISDVLARDIEIFYETEGAESTLRIEKFGHCFVVHVTYMRISKAHYEKDFFISAEIRRDCETTSRLQIGDTVMEDGVVTHVYNGRLLRSPCRSSETVSKTVSETVSEGLHMTLRSLNILNVEIKYLQNPRSFRPDLITNPLYLPYVIDPISCLAYLYYTQMGA